MSDLRYTLITDGSSDAALLPILTRTLRAHGVRCAIQPSLAETWALPSKAATLEARIRTGIELYPCDLLFVHRDAENQDPAARRQEICRAAQQVLASSLNPTLVCVIPVRMQEAWLLISEEALRYAAGNRAGRQPLSLPQLQDLEDLPHPEHLLHELLRAASGLGSRRLKRFPVHQCALRVAEYIEDLTPLKGLSAFRQLEEDIEQAIHTLGWVME